VYKKLMLLVLALMFMAFSNLRVCCRLTVDGEAVPGSFSPVSADIAVTAAERAAEEILPGFADMPETERHYMLSLSRPDGSRAELADALRDGQQRSVRRRCAPRERPRQREISDRP